MRCEVENGQCSPLENGGCIPLNRTNVSTNNGVQC